MADRWLYAWGLGSISFGGASLLVPLYLVQLGASALDLGLLAASAAIVGAPGAIVFGRLADRVGHRRSLVVLTLATVAIALGVLPLLSRVIPVILVNAVLWLVVAAVAPVLTMIVVDAAPESAWSGRIGRLNEYQGYGWAIGLVLGAAWPAIAGLVPGVDGSRPLFWLLATCAAASAILAGHTMPRPIAHVASERKPRRIARLLSTSSRGVKGAFFAFAPNRLYWSTRDFHPGRLRSGLDAELSRYLAAAGLFYTGFAAFWAPLPLVLARAGFDDGRIFVLYLVSAVASAVLYRRVGDVAGGLDLRRFQSGALVVRGVLFAAVPALVALGAVTVRFGGMGIALVGIGATWAVIGVVGTAIVSQLAPPDVRGEVLGVHTAIAAVAGGFGAVLGGWIATAGYWLAFGVAGGLVLLGAGVVLSLRTIATDSIRAGTEAVR